MKTLAIRINLEDLKKRAEDSGCKDNYEQYQNILESLSKDRRISKQQRRNSLNCNNGVDDKIPEDSAVEITIPFVSKKKLVVQASNKRNIHQNSNNTTTNCSVQPKWEILDESLRDESISSISSSSDFDLGDFRNNNNKNEGEESASSIWKAWISGSANKKRTTTTTNDNSSVCTATTASTSTTTRSSISSNSNSSRSSRNFTRSIPNRSRSSFAPSTKSFADFLNGRNHSNSNSNSNNIYSNTNNKNTTNSNRITIVKREKNEQEQKWAKRKKELQMQQMEIMHSNAIDISFKEFKNKYNGNLEPIKKDSSASSVPKRNHHHKLRRDEEAVSIIDQDDNDKDDEVNGRSPSFRLLRTRSGRKLNFTVPAMPLGEKGREETKNTTGSSNLTRRVREPVRRGINRHSSMPMRGVSRHSSMTMFKR